LAVEQEFGGRDSAEKGQEMIQTAIKMFRGECVYADELQDFFEGFFDEKFNTTVDDGSIKQVSELLLKIHKESMNGKFAAVESLVGQTTGASSQSIRQNDSDEEFSDEDDGDDDNDEGDDEEKEDEEMDDALPPTDPREKKVDEDGFELVTNRRRR